MQLCHLRGGNKQTNKNKTVTLGEKITEGDTTVNFGQKKKGNRILFPSKFNFLR